MDGRAQRLDRQRHAGRHEALERVGDGLLADDRRLVLDHSDGGFGGQEGGGLVGGAPGGDELVDDLDVGLLRRVPVGHDRSREAEHEEGDERSGSEVAPQIQRIQVLHSILPLRIGFWNWPADSSGRGRRPRREKIRTARERGRGYTPLERSASNWAGKSKTRSSLPVEARGLKALYSNHQRPSIRR